MAQWPSGRSLHGGVDEIPLPEGPGRLAICGKHFIGSDPLGAMSEAACDVIVCLCEREEIEDRYPEYVRWLESDGEQRARWYPVCDLHAPGLQEARDLIAELHRLIREGHGVLMHCGAGVGRAGTMAAALLIDMGLTRTEALGVVSNARPMAGPEAGAQAELLVQLAGE
jgi:protein-tyrosine phosphatase